MERVHDMQGLRQFPGFCTQVAVAGDLAADLQLVQLAPDQLAAAMLVVLARAEGRSMPLSTACRTVRGACGFGSYSDVLCALVRQLEETWQVSPAYEPTVP